MDKNEKLESLKQRQVELYKKALKLKKERESMKYKILTWIKSKFRSEKTFKLFIVLQILFVSIYAIYFMTVYNAYRDFICLKYRCLLNNYMTIGTILLPLFIAKSVDWIYNKKDE